MNLRAFALAQLGQIASALPKPPDLNQVLASLPTPDQALAEIDKALKTITATPAAHRPNPAKARGVGEPMPEEEKKEIAGLMRVNHVGEVCAQALYQAQALATRNPELKTAFKKAAQEEADHLAWTAERLKELDAHPSLLNPLWYAGAFGLGYVAGKMGDTASLSFMAETEKQVEAHLAGHLERLPLEDQKSRAIVEQMKLDEIAHGQDAEKRGGQALPTPMKWAMKAMSKVMTTLAHRI